MLDKAAVYELLALAEKNVMQSEVGELLETCIVQQSASRFETYIQAKVMQHDAPVDFLQDLAESVHQHMVALQESLFELRAATLQSLSDRHQVDLVSLAPADLIEDYDRLELDEALAFVATQYPDLALTDMVSICHILHNSVRRAGEITQSIRLVRQILEYVFDWTEALSVNAIQNYWHLAQKPSPHNLIH
ncbi:MAG: hypothetical protein LCI00_05120 [Chloroflexi bacterium]|nr:hypothetical protein [Chloroflexota bacterium]MCC6896434.1 hypothetical protein [Anaerolineae bacterium]